MKVKDMLKVLDDEILVYIHFMNQDYFVDGHTGYFDLDPKEANAKVNWVWINWDEDCLKMECDI